MVKLETVRAANARLVTTHPLVAVFAGGTAGIGESTVRALASAHAGKGKSLRVYIVGRNSDAAARIIADCSRICPTGRFHFIKADDLALLKDVDRVCGEIVRAEEVQLKGTEEVVKVDLLVMSHSYLTFEGRRETSEGLDTLLSLRYYSRMRFIINLLPLLLSSSLPAHVVSVFAAGRESKLYTDDLSLRKPRHYGLFTNISHVAYMTTFFMEGLAARNPDHLGLVHVYPGLVNTDEFQKGRFPAWFKLFWRWVMALLIIPWFAVPVPECGERTLFLATPRYPPRRATSAEGRGDSEGEAEAPSNASDIAMGSDGTRGSGVYAVNWNGETIPTEKAYGRYRSEGLGQRVWEHTMKAFEEIEAGRVFRE